MRQIAALLALCLLLASCGSNRIDSPSDGAAVPARHGVLVLGFDRADELDSTPFVLNVHAVDASGRIDSSRVGSETPRRATAFLETKKLFASRPDTRFAFALEPGDYVLANVGIGHESRPYYYSTYSGGGGGGAGAAAIGLAALLLFGAIAVAATASDVPPPRPPMQYVQEEVAVAEAPRFRIQPGEVLYIGEILVGAEHYEYEVEDAGRRSGPNAYDQPAMATVRDTRLFAEYALDEPAARQYANSLQLGRRPFRTQLLRLSEHARTMFFDYAPVDTAGKRHRLARARPELPLTVDGAVTATSAPAATPARPIAPSAMSGSAGKQDLMRRFLAGETSKEDYDRERARSASGS